MNAVCNYTVHAKCKNMAAADCPGISTEEGPDPWSSGTIERVFAQDNIKEIEQQEEEVLQLWSKAQEAFAKDFRRKSIYSANCLIPSSPSLPSSRSLLLSLETRFLIFLPLKLPTLLARSPTRITSRD